MPLLIIGFICPVFPVTKYVWPYAIARPSQPLHTLPLLVLNTQQWKGAIFITHFALFKGLLHLPHGNAMYWWYVNANLYINGFVNLRPTCFSNSSLAHGQHSNEMWDFPCTSAHNCTSAAAHNKSCSGVKKTWEVTQKQHRNMIVAAR